MINLITKSKIVKFILIALIACMYIHCFNETCQSELYIAEATGHSVNIVPMIKITIIFMLLIFILLMPIVYIAKFLATCKYIDEYPMFVPKHKKRIFWLNRHSMINRYTYYYDIKLKAMIK